MRVLWCDRGFFKRGCQLALVVVTLLLFIGASSGEVLGQASAIYRKLGNAVDGLKRDTQLRLAEGKEYVQETLNQCTRTVQVSE